MNMIVIWYLDSQNIMIFFFRMPKIRHNDTWASAFSGTNTDTVHTQTVTIEPKGLPLIR